MRKKKYVKLSIGADMLKKQIICTIKIRRAPTTRHDNIDFKPIVTKTAAAQIKPLSIVIVADKGYDSGEENHVLVRDKLHGYSVIPPRYKQEVPVWKTHGGRYRKQMKYRYQKQLYNQKNKDETIVSVIKRLFGEHITSRLIRTQNRRELKFRCIAYNAHRVTNMLVVIMVSTKPVHP